MCPVSSVAGDARNINTFIRLIIVFHLFYRSKIMGTSLTRCRFDRPTVLGPENWNLPQQQTNEKLRNSFRLTNECVRIKMVSRRRVNWCDRLWNTIKWMQLSFCSAITEISECHIDRCETWPNHYRVHPSPMGMFGICGKQDTGQLDPKYSSVYRNTET